MFFDWEDSAMLATIIIGTCVLVQGEFISRRADGKIVVRDGEKLFTGSPVKSYTQPA